MSPIGSAGTFIYSPDIRVWIATENNGVIDVSDDIVSSSVQRNINAVSTFSCQLDNRQQKYDRVVQVMDRIMVWLQRTTWLQVFSGYVTTAPFETVLPNAVTVNASCTLKRLENTYWDATIPEAQAILPGSYTDIQGGGAQFSDGGAGQGMVNVMTLVPSADAPVFNGSQIHIQEIPTAFFNWATSIYQSESSSLDSTLVSQLAAAVDGSGVVAGSNSTPTASQTLGNAPNAGATIPYGGVGQASMYYGPNCPGGGDSYPFPGAICENISKAFPQGTKDLYGAALHWGYTSLNATDRAAAIAFLRGSDGEGVRLIVTNSSNGKSIVCRAIDYMAAGAPRLIDLSTTAFLDLCSKDQSLSTGILDVQVIFAPDQAVPDGPITSKDGSGGIASAVSASNAATATVTGIPTNAANAAVQAAVSQNGSNYSEATDARERPKTSGKNGSFDCSGLLQWSYKQAGISIPGTTTTQWAGLPHLPTGSQLLPGDAVFYQYNSDANNSPPDHVTIVTGVNTSNNSWSEIEASDPAEGVHETTGHTWKDSNIYGAARPSGSLATGTYSGVLNTGGTGDANDITQRTASGSTINTTLNQTNNFNILFTLPQIDPRAIMFYNSPRAFITDEPVLSTISQLCGASLRSFQSAPNGDFVAFFPDYFGVYGRTPSMQIRDIEITDFKISRSDASLATHVAVVGETDSINSGITIADWLSVQGIVTVQEKNIMNILFGSNGSTVGFDSASFLNKFGLRPYVVQKPEIRSYLLEFFYALQTFMDKWADQYSTTITTTFMPEVYPGMLVVLPDEQNLQVYVQAVTHNISRSSGFTTSMTVTCPTRNGQILELTTPEPWFSTPVANTSPIQ